MSKRRVVRVLRSPMNPHRWCLELECCHDVWVTAKSSPRAYSLSKDHVTGELLQGPRYITCPTCQEPQP